MGDVDRCGRGRSELRQLNVIMAVPGLLAQFRKVVPARFVDGDRLSCVCGTVTVLPRARPVECEGGCGRFFLLVRDRVVCAGPYVDEAAA